MAIWSHAEVPGSFHEIISRAKIEDGSLDLAFDAANAQGIFKMTTAESFDGWRPPPLVTSARANELELR